VSWRLPVLRLRPLLWRMRLLLVLLAKPSTRLRLLLGSTLLLLWFGCAFLVIQPLLRILNVPCCPVLPRGIAALLPRHQDGILRHVLHLFVCSHLHRRLWLLGAGLGRFWRGRWGILGCTASVTSLKHVLSAAGNTEEWTSDHRLPEQATGPLRTRQLHASAVLQQVQNVQFCHAV
jgi:hypothetical protein